MKLFKTLLVGLGLWATAAHADVTVINSGNKASPASVLAMAYKNAVAGEWYQAKDCEDALRVFNATKNAVLIYNSSLDFAARNKNMNCTLQGVNVQQIIFTGHTYMDICRKPGSTADLNSNKTTLGMASMYAVARHEKNFNTAGANIKLVPYGGSQEIVTAVRAGDIDLGWIGSGMAKKQGSNLDCLYTTDPSAPNFLGKKLKLAIPDFKISYVLYTNTTDPNVLKKLRAAANNKEFSEFLESSDTVTNWNSKQKDLDEVNQYVRQMMTHWGEIVVDSK